MIPYPGGLPVDVIGAVRRYLAVVDASLPGRVEGLYLVGSVALDEYVTGQSDIDFVAVTGSPLGMDELASLRSVHSCWKDEAGWPMFDGIYVLSTDLARNPLEIETVPHALAGRFECDGGFEANPVTWWILRDCPVVVRGARPTMWYDAAVLQQWNRDNLRSYWSGMLDQLEGARGRLVDDEEITRVVGWCVPSVTRLAVTIATGKVVSKSAACRYALERYPPTYHSIVRTALNIRSRHRESLAPRHVGETIEYLRYVIAAAA